MDPGDSDGFKLHHSDSDGRPGRRGERCGRGYQIPAHENGGLIGTGTGAGVLRDCKPVRESVTVAAHELGGTPWLLDGQGIPSRAS